MALREKFGRLVLLEETEAGSLCREYRAARLGPAGVERLVTVLRFGPEVSSHPEAPRRLMEEARLAARLQSPGLVRVLGIGRVERSFYVSTELAQGRSVAAILERCRAEAFPFAAEHALMIASRAASALESLHARKDEAGAAVVHGLIAPARLVVAFDGEVKLKGLGLWPALRGTALLPAEERRHLAPEQLAGGAGDPRSDVYALALVLLESLTGRGPDGSPVDALAEAKITSRSGAAVPLPNPLERLLCRALDQEPAARFAGASDLRRAIDALLFSGDFTPTTFDLAFFMHTLFRDDMEREARSLEEARRGDYREFFAEEKAAAPSPATEPDAGPPTEPAIEPARDTVPVPRKAPPAATEPTPAESSRLTAFDRPPSSPGPGPDSSGTRAAAARTREAAARMTLGGAAASSAPGRRPGPWLIVGLLGAVVLGGSTGWVYFATRGASAPRPADEAAPARVRELEARIAQLEREKAGAEAKAAEDARSTLEAEAAAGGTTVGPALVARAQQEARQRARREEERRQQEEMQRLAADRTIEVERLAADATPVAVTTPTPGGAPAPAGPPAATPTPTPTPTPQAPPATEPPTQERAAAATPAGPAPTPPTPTPRPTHTPTLTPTPAPTPGPAVADPRDPGVKPPALQSEDPVPYPSRAISRRIATSVVVRALVDSHGRVAEATIVQPSGQPPELGFDEAALRRVRSRRYRPARRHDVPVAMWVIVRIDFRPPRQL